MSDALSSTIEPLFDSDALASRVAELGRTIGRDLAGEDPLLLALLGGSVIFLADLVRAIETPVRFEFVKVGVSEPHGEGAKAFAPGSIQSAKAFAPGSDQSAKAFAPPGSNQPEILDLQYPIPVELAGQSVLVVKDVVASGVVESYLHEQIKSRGAATVRFAALIDLPDERKTDIEVDYHAFSAHRAGIFVGYGLKHHGLYGNLPYVGRLKEGS